ncbi:Mobile element protein [Caballeronia sordidicola]|uniref:Mobile element protein n=1 Tax=Caballeronia sordidicola TaxID=196367 RepID=A0A242MUQ2_CABSO|nr:Mobile element protein [Caballeronia sordidicola]
MSFLTDVFASQPKRREIHVICDNVSSHKTQRVADFLTATRNVRLHFTPTYSSGLNQVENWFSRIQRDVIARGVFTSVKDLDRKLMRFIREHNQNQNPKPIKWKYGDPSVEFTRCQVNYAMD